LAALYRSFIKLRQPPWLGVSRRRVYFAVRPYPL
jgi:hypothetical protein